MERFNWVYYIFMSLIVTCWSHHFSFLHRALNLPSFFTYHKHGNFHCWSYQCAGCMSYMNLEYGPARHECFVAQWLEHPTSVRKVIHRFDSSHGIRLFLCPVLVTCWSHQFSKNTVNPPLSPPGAYSFLIHLRGYLIEMGGLFNFNRKKDGISSP